MQSSPGSRKRPAPGTSPVPAQQQQLAPQSAYPYQQLPDNPDFSNFDFSQAFPGTDQTFSEIPGPADSNNFSSYLQNSTQPATYGNSNLTPQPAAPSTEIVRRARNPNQTQALAPTTQQQNGSGKELWNGSATYPNNNTMNGGVPTTAAAAGPADDEDEAALDRKVQIAKRDAQGKRKQIPPFVQKLSSFLDSNNTSLIRWSNDGRSFIVLDEDEFARTLIPELFKHNNYASFVRQLNMYGFHKTVNITDGSLRQSEKARKGVKPPSMYSHPYFRRGRQDLLWLIQKPSSKPGGVGSGPQGKRKRDGAPSGVKDQGYDSDEDGRQFSPGPQGPLAGHAGAIGALDGSSSQDVVIPRNELNGVRRELQKLQNQQRFISQMITQLKEQNDQFYRQATAFQALHDRHENSINAILTFLATFYNRNLEGHGAQNLVNMFAGQQNMQQHGSVEEVTNDGGGFDGGNENGNLGRTGGGQLQRFVKKPPLLLPGPVANLQNQSLQPGSAVTAPNSARTSASPPNDGSAAAGNRASTASAPPEGRVGASNTDSPVIKNETPTPTPNLLSQVPENEDIMSLINSVNATNASTPSTSAPAFDFNSALDHYQNANGNAPLTAQERDSMLSLMATHQGGNTHQDNSALVSPQPPQMPDLNQLKQTQQQLEMLTSMQKRQDAKVQELNRRLVPLSPTGSIPGMAGQVGDEDPFRLTGGPGDYDPNAFINFDDGAWANDAAATGIGEGTGDINFDFGDTAVGDGGDIDWDFGAGGGAGEDMFQTNKVDNDNLAPPQHDDGRYGGGRVESVSSEATSPAGTVPEEGDAQGPGTPRKRVRRS